MAATRQLLHEEFGHICHPDRLIAHWKAAAVETLCTQALGLKPGVPELLDLLTRLDLPCAIATSGYHHDVARNLRAAGLAGRLDVVIAHGDYAAAKPAPDPYLCAGQRLAVAPIHCLAIEDSAFGVRSARAAGMMTVMIPDLIQPDDALRALCTHVAPDMHAVCDMLR